MADFIKDLLNLVIQHSSGLLKTLELVAKWSILIMAVVPFLSIALDSCRSSRYHARHRRQNKEPSEGALVSSLDLLINAIRLLLGR